MHATDTHPHQATLALYVDHHGWLTEWLRQRLGCGQQAADLAQDTFVQLLAGKPPSGIHEPRAYLATIARRLMFNSWRRRNLERAWLDALAAQPDAVAPSEEERALVLEALALIDRALSRLSRRARQVFLLNQLHELTYAEIAERLGIATITVRRDMKAAIGACCLAVA